MKKLIVLAGVLVILAGCAGEKPVFRMEEKKELTAAEQNRLKAREAAQRLQMEKELETRLGALVREPMSAEAHHKVAYQCYVMGNTEKAVDYWQKALKLDPKHAKSLYSLGVLNHKLSKGDKALELWEKTIGADANFWQAYYNIGVEYHNRSQFQKAADYYGMALKVKPDHAKSYVNLGLAYFELFRDKDMVAVGTLTPDEAKELIEISLSILDRRSSEVPLQRTRSKAMVEPAKKN